MKPFRSPKSVIARFVVRRSLRGAIVWAIIFASYIASKAIGFVAAYPNAVARAQIATTFSNNIGIEILLGSPPHDATTAGFVAWNTLGIMVIFGSIWGLLLATKLLRGEEDAGRWEILLSGQTTAKRAAVNTLAGLGVISVVFFLIIALALVAIGRYPGVDFGTGPALLFALTGVCGIVFFMSLGALTSQLMPTRSRGVGAAVGVLGLSFLLRAVGDITSAHWVLNLTPFGWIEKLQPLSNGRPLWLLPLLAFIAIFTAATIYTAGKRDLGDSIFADRDSAKAHTWLLNSPFAAAFRLSRGTIVAWLTAITAVALLFGLLTKSAAQAFNQSASTRQVLGHLAHHSQTLGANTFLGVVFFLQMILIMAYAASSVSAVRRDEAEGYLDNFLVGPVDRRRWLWGRILLTSIVVIVIGALSTVAVWIGTNSQASGVTFHTILLADLNSLVPVVVTIGFGIFTFGLWPRLTALIAYGVIGWSFLVETVDSGVNLNHWILDTSLFSQVALAPAASIHWATNWILVALGLVLAILGSLAFNNRDLATE
jgi:ABC-2 type transport system permease protein